MRSSAFESVFWRSCYCPGCMVGGSGYSARPAFSGALDHAPVVYGDGRIDQTAAERPQPRQHPVLIGAREPAEADKQLTARLPLADSSKTNLRQRLSHCEGFEVRRLPEAPTVPSQD
jgi:hypothetical protein